MFCFLIKDKKIYNIPYSIIYTIHIANQYNKINTADDRDNVITIVVKIQHELILIDKEHPAVPLMFTHTGAIRLQL